MNNEENTALLTEQPSDQPSNYGAIESNEENQNSRQIVRFFYSYAVSGLR